MVDHILDMFLSSSSIHHLEAHVLCEHYLLIHLKDDKLLPYVFVHKLEARVLHEHNPLILLTRHKRVRILFVCLALVDLVRWHDSVA